MDANKKYYKPIFIHTEADIPENATPGYHYFVAEGPVQVVILSDGSWLKFTGGTGDPNDLGVFASVAELRATYPTANAGNFARVVSATENQIYIWSTTANDWQASGVSGSYVERVNGKTGPSVELGATDVGAVPEAQAVKFTGENNDVDLTGKGNVVMDKASKVLGTGPDGTEHVIGAISTYTTEDGSLTQNELGNTTNHTNTNSYDRPTVELPGGIKKRVAYDDDNIGADRLPMATDADIEAGTEGKIPDARQMKEAVETSVSTETYIDTGLTVQAAYEGETTFDVTGPLTAIEGKIAVGDKLKINDKIMTVTAIAEDSGTNTVYITVDMALLSATDAGAKIGKAEAMVPPDNSEDIEYLKEDMEILEEDVETLKRQVATSGYRNALINGAMEIAEWPTGGSAVGYQTLDRWRVLTASTLTQRTTFADFSGVPGATACARLTATGTAGMSVGQRIENAAVFSGEKATVSFWAKNSKATNMTIALTRSSGGTINLSQSVALTAGWKRYEVTFDVPAITTRPDPTTSYLQIAFTVTGTASGDALYLAMVQMEAGEVATAFERRNYGIEVNLCCRYYENNRDAEFASAPHLNERYSQNYYFRQPKRITPTMSASAASGWIGLSEGSTSNVTNLGLHVLRPRTSMFWAFSVTYPINASTRTMTVFAPPDGCIIEADAEL